MKPAAGLLATNGTNQTNKTGINAVILGPLSLALFFL
jgi:hypothetical protein